MRIVVAAVLAVLAVLAWPVVATAAPQPERAWEHARALVRDIGPRPAGSPAARAAADYVFGYFARLGVAVERIPVGQQHVPAIELAGDVVVAARDVALDDDTIVATLPATGGVVGPAILIMAHVDTVAGVPGAIDNAAAVGVLLELGRALHELDARPHEIILAATAGEEVGLVGARALAATFEPGRIGVALSLDLIGRSGPVTLNGLSANLGEAWLDRIAAAADGTRVAIEAPLTHQVVSRFAPQLERSDHGAFTELGVPAFHLFHRGPGRIYLQYHRPADTLEQIDAEAMSSALTLLHAFVLDEASLPPPRGEPATWMPVGASWVVRDRVLWIVELVMLALGIIGIVRGTSLSVTWRRRGSSALLALGVVMLAWLITAAVEFLALALGRHPQPWIHAPGRWTVSTLLVVGALLAAGSVWLRSRPHLVRSAGALALVLAIAPGALLLWFDVVALAWIPLVHGVGLAAMVWAQDRRTRALVLAVTAFPAWACVDPEFLREASFHGFLPDTARLTLVLVVPFASTSLVAVRLLSEIAIPVRWRIVMLVVAGATWIAVAVGAAFGGRQCEAPDFRSDGLACELEFTSAPAR